MREREFRVDELTLIDVDLVDLLEEHYLYVLQYYPVRVPLIPRQGGVLA